MAERSTGRMIVLDSLGKIYKVSIVTLASTVIKNQLHKIFSCINTFRNTFDLVVR